MSRSLLREMSTGEILDAAFTLYRRHFVDMVRLGLLFLGPALVLILLDPAIGYLAQLFLVLITTIVLLKRGSGHVIEEPTTFGSCTWTAVRRLLPVILGALVFQVGTFLGYLLLIIPGILLNLVWFAWMPIIVIEEKLDFPGRSTALARGAWLKILLVRVVSFIILAIPSTVIFAGAALTDPERVAGEPVLPAAFLFAQTVVYLLTMPFKAFVDLMLYYERRVAVDGYDVELATGELPSAEAALSV